MSVDVLIVEDLAQQKLPARCAASALQRHSVSVDLVDLNDGQAAIVARACAQVPRLVISSILFADRVDEHLALMTALRGEGLRAHLTLIGHLPTLDHARLLQVCSALDSVLRGDAEMWAPQVASCVAGIGHWQAVPGIAFRSRTTKQKLFPQPDTSLANYAEPLREQLPSFRGVPFATIESSRGCHHACTFCLPSASYRAQGVSCRQRPVSQVVDELVSLHRRGVRLFLFDDDEFLPPAPARSRRIEEFAAELDRRNLEIAFTIKCRADDVEFASFQRLKEMGLLRVYLGVESGSQSALDSFDKHTTPLQNEVALAVLQALGIVADFRCLLFHPWTTLETIDTDLSFLQKVLPLSPTLFDLREVQVYAGTPLALRLNLGGDSSPAHGLVSYTIADPRAESLQRMSRDVFENSMTLRQARQSVTEEWYTLLLARRFRPASDSAADALELTRAVTQVNAAMLRVWREMLKCARDGELLDKAASNARLVRWAAEINSACGRAY